MATFPRLAAFAVGFALLATACGGGDGATPPASSAPVAASPRSLAPGDPTYEVALRGTDRGTRWRGTQRISFTNTGTVSLQRVWLRLWANGVAGCDPRAVRVSSFVGGVPGALHRRCTAVPVTLPSSLDPGERASIRFALSIDVPARNDRFGAHGGLALLGNALPTLAVHDDQGWHLDPYVDLGESFYSVVGRYRVTLDVPATLRTPATGTLVSETRSGDRAIRTYAVQGVRDFAWATGSLRPIRGDAAGVGVTVWYPPSVMAETAARASLRDSVAAMTTYGRAFGAPPYPRVDVVLTAFTSFDGMEYPRIVFSNPERRPIAHELAHQWWYAIVGNDQYAEPWLDESFATWASFLPWTPWQRCPAYRWPAPDARLTSDMGYWVRHPREYRTIYEGGGCMLADLASRFGLHRFTDILADHAAAHWLGVTTTADFQRHIERAAARELEGFDADAYWTSWRVG